MLMNGQGKVGENTNKRRNYQQEEGIGMATEPDL